MSLSFSTLADQRQRPIAHFCSGPRSADLNSGLKRRQRFQRNQPLRYGSIRPFELFATVFAPSPPWRSNLCLGKRLRRRVNLVVVSASGEHCQLMKIVGEPVGGFGQVNEAVLDGCGLRVQAHDLVAVGLVARDARKASVDKVLDQLRP
jgi:hypothetical protein